MRPLLIMLLNGILCAPGLGEEGKVGPVPASLRQARNLDPFYQQHLSLSGFSILGSARVSAPALAEAAWILQHMLAHRTDILHALDNAGTHLTVMAWNEYTTDVPEHHHLKPPVYWDRRARGLGGSPVSCGEENLLGHPGDPYAEENLLIHEFAHAVHSIALSRLDPTFDARLKSAYRAAVDKGLWQGTYAGSNHEEYWAEAVQDWFDNNRENDALHNHVNTRAELAEYDPALASLCAEVLGDNPWRYRKPPQRAAEDRQHLASVEWDKLPRFRWRDEPIPDAPRVLIQTELGDVTLELDARRAPNTARNFLRYVHEGYFGDGEFFRTVTQDNQPEDRIKINVIQARSDPARNQHLRDPIALERTRDTGLSHEDGTISMARSGPDTAQDEFFLCIGPQPALNCGGQRNPDGQGFAAFGRVVEGMDVVRKIHGSKATGQQLNPPVRIQRAIRTN